MSRNLKPLRWSVEQAASEFPINPRTLASRLKKGGILAGDDGRWSTIQILEAVCGTLEGEKIRKTKAEADQIEMENAEAEKRLVDVTEFVNSMAPVYVEMKRLIRTSRLTDAEQDLLLTEMAKLHTTGA